MTNRQDNKIDDKQMDQLLSTAFPPNPSLSGHFEDQVMHEVVAIDRARARKRKVARLMAVYWGIATTIMSALLANNSLGAQPASDSVTAVMLVIVASGMGLAWFIARQSGIRLQNLFARTLL